MIRKEPKLHTTPEVLVRARPHPGPERIKSRYSRRKRRPGTRPETWARFLPQVEVVPCSTGYAVLADTVPMPLISLLAKVEDPRWP